MQNLPVAILCWIVRVLRRAGADRPAVRVLAGALESVLVRLIVAQGARSEAMRLDPVSCSPFRGAGALAAVPARAAQFRCDEPGWPVCRPDGSIPHPLDL